MPPAKTIRPPTRRQFLKRTAALAMPVALPGLLSSSLSAAEGKPFRAAIIGHTGAGNYGHGLDMIFTGRPDVEVVAVADADADGRAKAAARNGAARAYADYQEMLNREKPDLVSVAPRWTRQHHAMALAALHAGAHVFLEKPITRTLAEADELLSVARRARLKIAVAHQMRLAPNLVFLKQQLEAGLIGELLQIRAHGKQDHRAGGEDLIVLGVHLFDLMRWFAGDPQWCSGRLLQDGRDITLEDARPATEDIGPVAGDNLLAQFGFPKGVTASFSSRRDYQAVAGPWGMELIGTRGTVRILADISPRIFLRRPLEWSASGSTERWVPVEGDPTLDWTAEEKSVARANQRVVDDWLDAIRTDREPACSGLAGMRALEMAHAVFAAGLARARVSLPLANRQHPLARKG